jgi:hypothetical protein
LLSLKSLRIICIPVSIVKKLQSPGRPGSTGTAIRSLGVSG